MSNINEKQNLINNQLYKVKVLDYEYVVPMKLSNRLANDAAIDTVAINKRFTRC